MNIVGFILFLIFAAICFLIAKPCKGVEKSYDGYAIARATVECTMHCSDRDGSSKPSVEFIIAGFVMIGLGVLVLLKGHR